MTKDPLLAALSARRRKAFAVKVTRVPKRMDPEPGEFAVRVTYNGFQHHNLTFTPEEWRHVREAVYRFLARQARNRSE